MRHSVVGGISDFVAAVVFGTHGLFAVSDRNGYVGKLVGLSTRYRGFHGMGNARLVRASGILALLVAVVAAVLGIVTL